MYLCPVCSQSNSDDQPPKGVLKVLYNYEKLPRDFSKLQETDFIDLLPIKSLESLPNLRVGKTPLYR